MKRKIIKIDEEKCNGCGECIPNCKEGALKIVEGKARLVGDLMCDGLGACIGHCPLDAITIEEREAEEYDERKVMETLINSSPRSIVSHLEHLKEHNETEYYNQALNILKEFNMPIPITNIMPHNHGTGGCPGSMMVDRRDTAPVQSQSSNSPAKSELRQWPVQLHLVRPEAPYFKNSELVIMSTCGPVASADVHRKYLRNRSVVVACPKLDITDPYVEKLSAIFSASNTARVIVVIMEVPCCKGLSSMTLEAAKLSGREDIIVEEHVLSLEGELKSVNILYHN